MLVMSDPQVMANQENADIVASLASMRARVSEAHRKCPPSQKEPRLVAVSKTKLPEMVLCAYKNGQRHFGENYVQELVEKSSHPLLVGLDDIQWHFIGHLQRNKCNNLTRVPNLWAVQTVDSERLATTLNTSWKKTGQGQKLSVFIQVNTSGEESKHGCLSSKATDVVKHVLEACDCLEFCGLMTIGQFGHDYNSGPNPDFECLIETRTEVCKNLTLDEKAVELSMGMSADFEEAISVGSTSVRVGSSIFGTREQKTSKSS